ncbi:AAA family ATPase [Prosthecobacter vanneervenii]|uniref:Endopeptidase Clp ATP-binding regulatory subunit ClpX n=1 Tax=Prosthecobacter vanneervenii TaxID=48466 RepID=A0A7W7YAB1_9BACT|nr:AAA family ATPase [Prosthecobacter vanneervenii]MBB5032307.1 endopeptidase Clp ATP-binding regulatory subunit ClpX [Prosthecobacter vanneervenii]
MSDHPPEFPEIEKEKPKTPGSPEEITRKLEDFIKNTLGGQVLFTRVEGPGARAMPHNEEKPVEEARPDNAKAFEFTFRPADIKAHLDRFVIRQDEAKKVLATAVCDHYHHARMLRDDRAAESGGPRLEFSKQNVIIIGPTGVGKTYLVKHIADLIGVPFVKADATKFSETGYVGADVDDLVRDLVAKANGDIELAEHGIIYLDEIDKLSSGPERLGRDVSGRGVQTALLKLMEETEVSLYAPNDIRSQMQMMFDTRKGRTGREVVNTRNILFIVSGAFSGLEKIIEKRTNRKSIGFISADAKASTAEHLFREARTRDFIDYGFEAEFIGRLPVRVVCDPLSADDMFQIMKNSEGSLIRQYEREFAAYGVKAVFKDDALREIASRAEDEKTGARGLVTAWERVLRDFKFEMPSLGLPELVVDGALVKEPEQTLIRCRAESASQLRELGAAHADEVRAFAERFQREHGLTLDFESDAISALAARAQREGMHVEALCTRLFKDYPFGLKLVTRNTGETRFTITPDAVASPDRYVSDLVVNACRPQSQRPFPPTIDITPDSAPTHDS